VKEQSVKEVDDFIDSLTSKQFSKIREYLEEMPSAQINIDFECMECGNKNEHVVKGTANFF
jgi:5-methylcytosine-specific restriction endonuclease McrA